jgi:NAD+ synthase
MQLIPTLTQWLYDKVQETGHNGVVFGLSGGIDSAVLAAVCKKAFKNNSLGIIMPCLSSPLDKHDAIKIARHLDIETTIISLDRVYQILNQQLPQGEQLAKANIKPRLRMISLYYMASVRNSLVIGSGNKTELQVGYFTKYGDGGVDLLPLGSFYKTQIKEIAVKLNIPKEIINKKPSAGLWENQFDEEELGMSYPQLDSCLRALESGTTTDVPADRLDYVKELKTKAAHKTKMPPVFEPPVSIDNQ